MPAATRPTRKKTKPNPSPAPTLSDDELTPITPPPALDDDEDEDFEPSATPPPSSVRARGAANNAPSSRITPAHTPKNKGKLRAQDDDSFAVAGTSKPRTPAKSPKTPRGKVKAEDDDLYWGKDPDLEVLTHEGQLRSLDRIGMKTNKPRSLRPLWLQGVYQPSFFGALIPEMEDVCDQAAEEVTERRTGQWPHDGLAETWLDSKAYGEYKVQLMKFWLGQVGWVPKEGAYDMGWWPGKGLGWAQNLQRSQWAAEARQILQNDSDDNDAIAAGNHPGWPFIQPWLDTQLRSLTILSTTSAQPYLQDTHTTQRTPIHHPTTVMKLTVPELSMRSRLKRSIVKDSPKSAKRKEGDADDEDAASADDEDNALTNLEANQVAIDPADPKFADIPNLGFEEKGPICGEILHVSVGPPDQEVPVQVVKGMPRRLDSLGVVPDEGHLMNVGGHVYALDWVPVPVHLNTGKEYFVVSAAASTAPMTMIGKRESRPLPASLQIWSVSPDSSEGGKQVKGEARLEMIICHEGGTAFKLAWCPIGHDFVDAAQTEGGKGGKPRRLGLLAGCFADGSVSVFSVPHPDSARSETTQAEPVHIHLDPVLRLQHPQQAATSLAWAGGELLALGGSRGWLGVWNVGRILRSPSPPSTVPIPDYVVRAHRSAITDLTFLLLPPLDANGIALTSSSPKTLFSVSLDGWTALTDLTRCTSTSIERSRTIHYACAFSPFSGGSLVHEHADGSVAHYSLRAEEMLRSRQVSHTPSRVLALASSAFHPMLAMGTAHGELKVANTLRTLRRTQRNHLPIFQQVINRSTGELMIRHHLLPEIANQAEPKSFHLAQWHPLLAVTAVRWNPNLGRSRLLLSGTSAGLVKVDFVKPPFE